MAAGNDLRFPATAAAAATKTSAQVTTLTQMPKLWRPKISFGQERTHKQKTRRVWPNENEKKINDKRQIALNVALIEAMSA